MSCDPDLGLSPKENQYFRGMEEADFDLTNQEIFKRVKLIMPYAHNYGYFALEIPKMRTDAKEATEGYEHARIYGEKILAYKKDVKVLEYLFKEGFINYRLDIKQNDQHFVELTDRGRKLKKAGSIESFNFKEKYYPTKTVWEFIRTVAGILIGALLGYYLQKEPINKVSVEAPKLELQVVHDTIHINSSSGRKDTSLVRFVKLPQPKATSTTSK
jgi:hypothetical protein